MWSHHRPLDLVVYFGLFGIVPKHGRSPSRSCSCVLRWNISRFCWWQKELGTVLVPALRVALCPLFWFSLKESSWSSSADPAVNSYRGLDFCFEWYRPEVRWSSFFLDFLRRQSRSFFLGCDRGDRSWVAVMRVILWWNHICVHSQSLLPVWRWCSWYRRIYRICMRGGVQDGLAFEEARLFGEGV